VLIRIRKTVAVAFRSFQMGESPAHFLTSAPSSQNAVDIFRGEWASKLPLNGVDAGKSELFDDPRLGHFLEIEPIEGQQVLELGPLEGGHSSMLQRAGARSVLSVESNSRAYLKCLIVKELLGLDKVRFVLGDAYRFLETDQSMFDLAVAYGILYHLRDPQRLFELLAPRVRSGGRLLLWTHHWTETVEKDCDTLRGHFTGSRTVALPGGKSLLLMKHDYGSSFFKRGFFGGNARYSEWMPRQGILDAAAAFGFQPEAVEDVAHPNGPSIAATFRKT
jgi:SAM-dependent methyltransferase